MIIDLQGLPAAGARYEGEDPASILDLSADRDAIRVRSPVAYAVHAQLCGQELLVRGRLNVAVAFRCSRCAEWFSTTLVEPDFFCNHDMDEEKSDRFVDLTPDIRESILLAFPSHPVCRPACKGLCPQCGANWNQESCSCRAPAEDRWGALDKLST